MTHKLIIFLMFFLAVSCESLQAQELDPNKTYKYEFVRNNPEEAASLNIGILPILADINAMNTHLAYRGEVSYRFKNLLQISGGFQKAFLHFTEEPYDEFYRRPVGVSVYKPVKENGGDVTLTFFLIRKLQEKEYTLKLKSEGIVDYVTTVPANRLTLMGPRLGWTSWLGLARSEDLVFRGYDVSDPSMTLVSFSGEDYSTMYRTSMVHIGFTMSQINDLITNWKEFGERNEQSMTEFYADVLYALNTEIDNMLVPVAYAPDEMIYYDVREFNVNENTARSDIGFRAGVVSGHLNKFGLYGGMELGARPGLKLNPYFQLKVGFRYSGL